MKVLVIDDDETILELVSQYLTLSSRFEVHAAISARAALDAIDETETPFDCFLVDIQMRGVDGITLIQLLRETPGYQDTPIIMLTAMQEKNYIDRAFSAGATDYVAKPFDFGDLERRLQSALDLSREAGAQAPAPEDATEATRPASAPKAAGLDDPIALPEIRTAIDYAEFVNYIEQLQIRRFSHVRALAVKIGGVDRLHSDLAAEDFLAVIRDVALTVEKTLLPTGGMLSYGGRGVFFCIPEPRLKGHRKAMQNALNKGYQVRNPPADRVGLNLFVGEQIPLGDGPSGSVLDTLAHSVDQMEGGGAPQGAVFTVPKNLLKRKRIFSLG